MLEKVTLGTLLNKYGANCNFYLLQKVNIVDILKRDYKNRLKGGYVKESFL